MIANINPNIPTEKLFTNISNPEGIFPSTNSSNFLITHPPSGPIIIPPINIVVSPAPTTIPTVAIAPITEPLSPAIILPPV